MRRFALPFPSASQAAEPAVMGAPLRRRVPFRWLLQLGLACGLASSLAQRTRGEDPLQYNQDIRPILFDACFTCHGPDSAARKADLRLDQREAAVEMGAIVPGDADGSEMMRRILSSDPDEVMPPPATKKTLSEDQRQQLVRWINEGAEYQLHWSFLPPVRVSPPVVRHADWVRNPIDNFVAARFEAIGLEPAPEADRRTLARRVSLDLTGLPPDPELVEAFVQDTSANAYEKLVDTLLESPHWGEHRGRYWLDYARYADTHGIHFDNYREMWIYRDWVIQAFNRNLPFDEFTIENLAGDLLPGRSLDQQVGSGFHRCNMTTNEGGIIDEEYAVLYTRDRTETTSQVWLGLTANCAVCHSHKFDPLSQREFYEMSAFFNNTTQGPRDGNIKDTPPVVAVPLPQDRPRWEELLALIPQAEQQREARRQQARPDFDAWLAAVKLEDLEASVPRESLVCAAPLDEGQGDTLHVTLAGQPREVPRAASSRWQPGLTASRGALEVQGAACELPDVGDFEADQPFSCAVWIKLPANDSHGAVCARMDNTSGHRGWDLWVQQRRIGMHMVNQWPDTALKVVAGPQIAANEWVHVAVSYDGSGKAAGVRVYYNGQLQPTNVENDRLSGSIRTTVPFKIGQRHSSDPLAAGTLQDLRIYQRALSDGECAALARLGHYVELIRAFRDPAAGSSPPPAQLDELYAWWLTAFDPRFQSAAQHLTELEHERNSIQARGTIAHVMQEQDKPAMAYVLARGEYDKRGEEVTPDTPDVLPPFPGDQPRNRLGLARWLLLPEHPLTARVTVNRFWQEVFGTGLVRTTGDFGVAGELPSHPELLDWLALEFRDSGWDVKRFFKLLVMSATYRQSAVTTPQKLELDPPNRLLSRGPRFRMDAEMVRDSALAACGLLAQKIGGPSVKPYQPPGVWEAIAMDVSNTRSYQPDTGEGLYRRSLYTFWKRMAPPASLDIFNAPNREFCVVRRERTNTPLQALVTLNDEQYIEAARHLAERAIDEVGDSFEGRVNRIGLRLVAREFRPDEQSILRQSLDKLQAHYAAHPDEASQLIAVGASKPDGSIEPITLAAWTMLTNELMNLDEVLNK